MDENTNKKIEELKRNPPNRLLPVLLIPVAMAAVFCYRVATTDPRWSAAEPQPAATPAKPAAARPAPRATSVQPATPAPSTIVKAEAPAPAAETPAPASTEKAATAAKVPAAAETARPNEPATESPAAESSDSSALDNYLSKHLGQRVPFLYKGEERTVTIAAFNEETVTIKRKKSFTLKRSDLTPEQLALWK